jgi:hypothetical protein
MTTPDNDRPAGTTDFGEADRNYTDDPARTTDVGESDRDYTDDLSRTTDVDEASRADSDEPARMDVAEEDRAHAEEPIGSAADPAYEENPVGGASLGDADPAKPVGSTGLGETDPAYADEADRSAYGNADRLEDGGGTDASDRPADDAVDEDRGSAAAPEVSPDDPLVPDDIAVDFKARWDVIQQGFVDDPRVSVTDADKLVSDVLERLSTTFDQQHQSLEGQWSDGEPSTEDLRGALQRYRAFFDRLLTL